MELALLVLALAAAAADWAAVAKGWKRTEYFAKPAVMVFLFVWLYAGTRLQGGLLWFGLGILFSLAGDALLMAQERFFLAGLIAFLLAHIAYIIGFSYNAAPLGFWDIALGFILALAATRILGRLVSALKSKGAPQLILPVRIYGLIISVMLFMAMRTLAQPTWEAGASILVSAGAFLFYISDLILAWNKFVSPIKNGRLLNITAYHLGQIALIVGVAMQFGWTLKSFSAV
ncbi:MAG: lysoplasmalogenase [Chloroflexi bacterium]|nr:lysoplasmalogenase [Chloroflexota bacterium]MBI3338953.1 lysoplasmalogenase [Chloroflexota bacterium]